VCTAIKKNAINGIKLCLSFSPGLKFQVVYFKKMLQLLGDSVTRPSAGASPLGPTGDFSPPDPLICPPLHLLDPPWLSPSTPLRNDCTTGARMWNCKRRLHPLLLLQATSLYHVLEGACGLLQLTCAITATNMGLHNRKKCVHVLHLRVNYCIKIYAFDQQK